MTKITPAKKSLGQHFLIDQDVSRRIVQFAEIEDNEAVIEIGPGLGHLTEKLLETGAHVTAIEFDRDMIDHLRQRWPAGTHLRVLQANVLRLDWRSIVPTDPVKVVGNLPYNISSRIIRRMMPAKQRFQSLVLMVQREMAQRLLAEPGQSDYGLFSVLSRFHFQPEYGFDVQPPAFRPRPAVVSTVLRLTPKTDQPASPSHEQLDSLLRQAFCHPRKTLLNNLKASGHQVERLEKVLSICHTDPRKRPQELDLEAFACLARML